MKGVILAGGAGSRLYPITNVVIKQILPVYDKPMIYYPLSCLMLAGIQDVLIISTPRDITCFIELFGNGSLLGMHFEYAVQEKPNGLADAFIVGKEFIGNDDVVLVLGDNIFYGQSFTSILMSAVNKIEKDKGAVVFGYYVTKPEAYGVLEFDKENNAIGIEEKPKNPKSHYAIPGLYFYDNSVVEKAASLKPSSRNELEITDLNKMYLKEGTLSVELLGRGMTWFDSGTYDGLLEASNFVSTIQKRQGLYISCIEEIAYNNGWISKEQLLKLASGYSNEYGRYLVDICHLK
ncbi:MAG: glucose-1-phosphate thymidylyltransferase RfbA [Spirochaetia bacterium]|nr:glucose-1-phosphate thymidylyltransferase RfbA [Spirochaetia bacterium]MDY4985092.1 glucose-1-phosphate thymidylyltransferase RfbA [Treponema sp.]